MLELKLFALFTIINAILLIVFILSLKSLKLKITRSNPDFHTPDLETTYEVVDK